MNKFKTWYYRHCIMPIRFIMIGVFLLAAVKVSDRMEIAIGYFIFTLLATLGIPMDAKLEKQAWEDSNGS